MANAADYLLLDTTQLLTTYKLRTRSVEARRFVARNIAPNYVLSVNITPTISGITLTPSAFSLQPNETATVTVEYDTAELEVLPPGTLSGALTMAVSAVPIVIPEIPSLPSAPSLPEAPRQVVSRIQITPTNFTLSEVGETTQFNAVLYVDDVPTPATFRWSLENNRADAFVIDENTGIVKALTSGITKTTVKATLLTPTKYLGTEGLAIAAANIPVIIPVGGEPVPTTGNLTVVVNGMSRNIGANITISGINQSITETTTFNNIPAGNYTVTPNVVTVGGVNYNPTGGGEIVVAAGQNTEIAIQYTKQLPPDVNTIQIVDLLDARGNLLKQGESVNVGTRITVVAKTYRNGLSANIGDVQFTVNNTQEGVQTVQAVSGGEYRATFTVTEPGVLNVTAYNQLGGSVTGQINSRRVSQYSIKINAPGQLILGQYAPVTAVVLQDGVETNIPVELEIAGGIGTISSQRPEELTPQPTSAQAAQTGTAIGGSIVDTGAFGTSGGVSTGGAFDMISRIDQGQNVI